MSRDNGAFQGKAALVTGAASGIGLAAARRLWRDGASLVAVDRDEAGLDRLVSELDGDLGEVVGVVADVSDEASVMNYVARALDASGRIDLFVNNAGIEGRWLPIVEQDVADFDAVMAVNVRGVFLGLREVLKAMIAQGGGGSICNTASMGGLRGGMNFSPYVASKHAVVGLTRSVAQEAAPYGIRVNAVAPGHIDTRMARNLTVLANPEDPAAAFEARAATIPLKRYGTPEEVANLIAFLLSDEASYITGTISSVDAGLTA